MKKQIIIAFVLLASALVSCEYERPLYKGESYIAFADTLTVLPVQNNEDVFPVMIAATVASDRDRVIGVEIVSGKGTTAVEGRDFSVDDFNVTIPAGSRSAAFYIRGLYDGIGDPDGNLEISLRLAFIDEEQDETYDKIFRSETKVRLQKIAPFNIGDFTGYAVMNSGFLSNYRPYDTQSRLVKAGLVSETGNTVLLHNLFTDGYDVELTFAPSDPLAPSVSLETGTPIGENTYFSFLPLGDGVIRVAEYPAVRSVFDTNRKTATIYNIFYIRGAGSNGSDGLIGAFATSLRWISDAEAEDILKNGF